MPGRGQGPAGLCHECRGRYQSAQILLISGQVQSRSPSKELSETLGSKYLHGGLDPDLLNEEAVVRTAPATPGL